MDFKEGQIWVSNKYSKQIVVTVYEITNCEYEGGKVKFCFIHFKAECGFYKTPLDTEWEKSVLEGYIKEHEFKLVNTLEK